MAKVYVRRNEAGVVVFQSPRRGPVSEGREEYDLPAGGSALGATVVGGVLVPPSGPTVQETQIARLRVAYLRWVREVRNTDWPDVAADRAVGRAALLATNRWVYQQVAIGDLLVRGAFLDTGGSAVTDADTIEASVRQIEWACETLAPIWYRVMAANTGLRASWSAAPVTDGSLLYSDIVSPDGVAVERGTIGGQFTALPGNLIPANFDPEAAGLRTV